MKYAVISGDIVSSSSLSVDDGKFVAERLNLLRKELTVKFGVYVRILKGD